MSDVQPLIALLEMMLNLATPVKAPNIKPGGYPEDMFKDLSEQEKEDYHILKEPRMCLNNHKFCKSCLNVWTTSGHTENHEKCPVCRTQGYYIECREIGEKLGRKIVVCPLKSCKWSGPLRQLGSHQHTTYTKTGLPYKPTTQEAASTNQADLPPLQGVNGTENRIPLSDRSNRPTYRLSDRQLSSYRPLNRNEEAPMLSRTPRNAAPSVVSRRTEGSQGEGHTSRTPRPPSVPRPQAGPSRRRPTLPSIISQTPNSTARSQAQSEGQSAAPTPHVTDSNNNNNSNPIVPNNSNSNIRQRIEQQLRQRQQHREQQQQQQQQQEQENIQPEQSQGPLLARRARMHVAPHARESETEISIRDRLRESRHRLDNLMSTFSTELDRGRRELTEFQEQRERRRQEQLAAVRDLGRRLGSVASELRLLLEQRRQLRDSLPDTPGDL